MWVRASARRDSGTMRLVRDNGITLKMESTTQSTGETMPPINLWILPVLAAWVIPGAGHFVQQDASDLVSRTIRAWLLR